MILGGVAAVWQIYVGVINIGNAMHYTYRIGEQAVSLHAAERAMKIAIWVMAAKLLACQILVGGGGFARYKLKKMLVAKQQTPAAAAI